MRYIMSLYLQCDCSEWKGSSRIPVFIHLLRVNEEDHRQEIHRGEEKDGGGGGEGSMLQLLT